MKCPLVPCLLSLILVQAPAWATIRFVTDGGTGTGASWSDSASLESALAAAQDGDEIRLKAGTYAVTSADGYVVTNAITLAGGYAGDGDTLAAVPVTELNGAHTYPTTAGAGLLNVTNAATASGGTVTLRRLKLAASKYRGIFKSGVMDLKAYDCELHDNSNKLSLSGRGAYLKGKIAVTEVAFSNCVFSGNGAQLGSGEIGWGGVFSGGGALCENLKKASFISVRFVTNGLPRLSQSGRDFSHGGALYASSAPIVATNCAFVGNGSLLNSHTDRGNDGAVIYLCGDCGGTVFSDCTFTGNFTRKYNGISGTGGGVITQRGFGEYLFDNITVAYNGAATGNRCATGLTVQNGHVTVRNSIFHSNSWIKMGAHRTASDIYLNGGALHLEDTILSTNTEDALYCSLGTLVTNRVSCVDPQLGKDEAQFLTDLGLTTLTNCNVKVATVFQNDAALTRYDVHPASAFGSVAFDGDVTVSQIADASNPSFSFAVSGGNDGRATVALYTSKNATGWDYVNAPPRGYRPGEAVTIDANHYFEQGDVVRWKIVLTGRGGVTAEKTGSFTVEANRPVMFSAGGGAKVVHCWSKGSGTGDGSSWGNAYTTYEAAIAALLADETKEELWLADERVDVAAETALTRAVAIRGGFTGGESAASERLTERRTVLDGRGLSNFFSSSVSLGTIVLDGVSFEHSYKRAVSLTGTAGLDVRNSSFFGCGLRPSVSGAGLYVNAKSALVVSNVVFDSCLSMDDDSQDNWDYGYGVLLVGLSGTARFTDTDFLNCGFPVHSMCSRSQGRGSVMRIEKTKIAMERCEIRGCGARVHSSSGVVYLDGACGGSAFTNCVFAGNHGDGWSDANSEQPYGAVMSVVLNATNSCVDVVGCTFAYNVAPMRKSATALTVTKGTVNVVDSIFHGNRAMTPQGGANDIFAESDGTVNVTSTMFDGEGATYVGSSGNGTVNLPAAVLTDDPLFATPEATFSALLDTCQDGKTYTYLVNGSHMCDFDVHLRSSEGRYEAGRWVTTDASLSPAIDQGTLAYDREPAPNGGARNLGAYGNTQEASKSPQIVPEFADFTVDTTCDYSQPHFFFGMTGRGAYSATLYVCWGDSAGTRGSTEGWEHVTTFSTVAFGEDVEAFPRAYFQPGQCTYWQVLAVAPYGSAETNGYWYVDASLPPWYGKGGGANVIHVRTGATGQNTGLDWTDAYPDFETARLAMTSARNELWFSGTFSRSGESPTISLANDVTFRGGFAGTENSPAERNPSTPRAVLRGEDTDYVIKFAGASALLVDRMEFTGYTWSGVCVSGGSAATFADSALTDCVPRYYARTEGVHPDHHALYVSGGTLTVTNCSFSGNVHTNTSYASGESMYGASGMALGLYRVTRTEVVDTLFATNGLGQLGLAGTIGREDAQGVVVSAYDSPVRFLRCGFVGNRGHAHNEEKTGALVYLGGACGGSTVESCRFVGNVTRYWSQACQCRMGGVLAVNLQDADATVGVTNCTFAYNLYAGGPSVAAINVRTGSVSIVNSVFHGNVAWTNKLAVADLRVDACATVNVAWSLFDSTNEWHVANAGALTVGEGLQFGKPGFVSKFADFRATLKDATQATEDPVWPWITKDADIEWGPKVTEAALLDVHETRRGLTMDRGDPASPYALEPYPNGRRVNLGAYGNTREALRFPPGLQVIIR